RRHPPQAAAAADGVQEVAEDLRPLGRVADLRVELQAVHRPAEVAHRSDRASVSRGQGQEVAVDRLHLITVAHPDVSLGGDTLEQPAALMHAAGRPAELAHATRFHRAAENLTGELQTVADAEDGDVQVEDGRVALRGARLVDTGGAAGQDDAARLQLGDAG